MSTKWVIITKNETAKARLVVRGFEWMYILPTDSPTVGKGAMRMVLAIVSSKRWLKKTTDIKSAFYKVKNWTKKYILDLQKKVAPQEILSGN